MEGTAASRSTREAAGWLSHRGEYCVMNSATPTPTGTAMHMAMIDEATVTQSIVAIPKRGLSPATCHSVEVRKLVPFLARAGSAWDSRNVPIRMTSRTTSRPALLAAPPNRRSPSRPVEARSPWRGPRPCESGSSSTVETPVMLGTSGQTCLLRGQERASIAAMTLVSTAAGSGA